MHRQYICRLYKNTKSGDVGSPPRPMINLSCTAEADIDGVETNDLIS